MSIADRRNSLRKSSIGIDSIRKSITSLGEGLVAIGSKSRELLKQTRETNQFKSRLIRQDGEFFRKRREGVLRKQREDELEASTVTGIAKQQGSLVQKSTRGFLGRMLNFVGILILGWAVTNLPRIIAAFQKLFGLIKRVVGVLGAFVEGMKNFLLGIGTGIDNFLSVFDRFNFREDDKKIKDSFEESGNNLTKLNKDFVESAQQFSRDKDINSAGQVAQDLGIEGGGEEINEDSFGDFSAENEKEVSDAVQTFTADEVAVIQETGVIPEPRAEGGPVIEGRPYIVGEEGEELFVPNESGEIVPNDELDTAMGDAANIEGTGGEDTAMSVTPDKPSSSGTASTAAAPTTSSLDSDDFETDDEMVSKVDPVSSDKSISVTPVKRTRRNLRSRRRRKTIVQMPTGGGTQLQEPSMNSGTKTKTIVIGNSSTKTLLDLQSLNNKHN